MEVLFLILTITFENMKWNEEKRENIVLLIFVNQTAQSENQLTVVLQNIYVGVHWVKESHWILVNAMDVHRYKMKNHRHFIVNVLIIFRRWYMLWSLTGKFCCWFQNKSKYGGENIQFFWTEQISLLLSFLESQILLLQVYFRSLRPINWSFKNTCLVWKYFNLSKRRRLFYFQAHTPYWMWTLRNLNNYPSSFLVIWRNEIKWWWWWHYWILLVLKSTV
jgi:hypothetical protein